MAVFERISEFLGLTLTKRGLLERAFIAVLSLALLFATSLPSVAAGQDQLPPQPTPQDAQQADQPPPPPPPADSQQANQAPPPGTPAPPYAQQTPEQLQQLVAPIALYPDSLVAQILAASTFPEQVVEADRFVQAHPDLKGKALGDAVDTQPWDPSVKALTAFPTVLGNMDKNLSWTSSLGDAYYNQQQDVMTAVQQMRQRAQQAGDLKSTPQQTVTTDNSNIEIQPTDTNTVYVPEYDPWAVYGDPILPWPGWYEYPGIWWGGPYLSFGIGFPIGWWGGFGWGWGYWGFDWYHHYPIYNHGRYFSRSTTFYNRDSFYRGGGARGAFAQRGDAFGRGGYDRGAAAARPFNGDRNGARGYAQGGRSDSGMRSGAFSDYGRGGETRSFSSRGSASFGGGGFRGGGGFGGGGGFHGGGGGGRR
jgi:Protein of unknown function (DUF3300)